ncbi:hypothetical protein GCM10027589_36940 [Actinocorallia lasiicapitis]
MKGKRFGFMAALMLLLGLVIPVLSPTSAHAGMEDTRPDFRLPFPCNAQILLQTYAGHNPDDKKIDMYRYGMRIGSPILASASGVVHEAFSPGGLEIRHGNGWFTTYMHMTDRVPVGTVVNRGDVIGKMGEVGTVGSPHLHYEQLYNPNSSEDADNQHITYPKLQGQLLVMVVGSPVDMTSTNCGGGNPPAVRRPYASGRVVSGRSADGRLEVFAAGAGGVHHAWQTAPNGGWSPWENLGGPQNAQLAIVPNNDGRLELFALSNSTLDHIWQTAPNAGWSSWQNFGTGGHRIAAANNADGRIEVFASNSSGVFHRWQTSPTAWSGWTGTNGPANSRLAMETAPDGRLEVFALSDATFGHLFQTAPSGGWGAWENFGTGGQEVTVNHNTDGRLEVFASNSSGVFHRWQTNPTTWSGWVGTNGPTNAKLSSARTPDGRVEVFAMSNQTAAHIWQTGQNQAFSAWETFGGPGTSVTATNNADGRIDVFGTNSTGVYHRWQTSLTAWSNWDQVNGPGPAMP